jgi:hypothetical protein
MQPPFLFAYSMNRSKIDAQFIQARLDALKKEAGDRNAKMDRFERLYKLNPWQDPARPGEICVSLPTAFDLVEKFRALLMIRPPSISVPPENTGGAEQERVQRLERYLYGVMHKANLERVLADADWYANCLGVGAVKVMYDRYATDDDFPILFVAPDPRSLYWRMNASKDRPVELIHAWDRQRRKIEDEWGITLDRPARWTWLPWRPGWMRRCATPNTGLKPRPGRWRSRGKPKLLTELVATAMLGQLDVEPEEDEESSPKRWRVRSVNFPSRNRGHFPYTIISLTAYG